jgi:glycerophosphoryl diester phosphodiesterase
MNLPLSISLFFVFLLSPTAFTRTVYPWQQSMTGTCWTDTSCNRSLIVSHGGDWTLDAPYDSLLAFERAFDKGADCVKGDFRVAQDNIGVVAHSSPILYYESPQCMGKLIENMTSAEVTECHLTITSQTYITVPHLLEWARDKAIVMLCVKEQRDIARAITTIIENNATDRSFLELRSFLSL